MLCDKEITKKKLVKDLEPGDIAKIICDGQEHMVHVFTQCGGNTMVSFTTGGYWDHINSSKIPVIKVYKPGDTLIIC